MKDKFNYEYKDEQIRQKLNKLGWRTGAPTVSKAHLFNTKKVGEEGVNSGKYIILKIAPNKWVLKHHYIYEQAYGPIDTKKERLIFLDGNRYNITLDNLVKVSIRESAYIASHNLTSSDPALTLMGINIAKLILKINDLKKI